MNDFADLLQEHLERLEAGEPLGNCLEGLPEEEATLLQIAASLRELPYAYVHPMGVARRRTQLLQRAIKETPMNNDNDKVPFSTWLRSALTTLPGAAVGLAALALIIWLSFNLFRPAAPSAEMTDAPLSIIEETSPAVNIAEEETETTVTTVIEETEETVAESDETTAGSAVVSVPINTNHLAFLPSFQSNPLIDASTASVQEPRGLVEIQAADGTWQVAHNGSTFKAGQRLRTGALSSARLAFYDGSQASIGANAEISLDQLDAQRPATGFRTVIMTQWLGESEHHVAFRNDNGSHYEVKTPNGSGVARGTIFQVLVTADLLTHYTVIEGRVDVTNVNVTVIVVAGHITIINPNEAPSTPFFTVSGQGEVTALGETWTIGGQTFETTETTIIVGNPQIGDIVHVTGYMLPDGTLVATHIVLLHQNSANRFTLTGEVTVMEPDSWVVAGQTISVTTETVIDEAIVLGDIARVQGIILADGTLVAESIALVEDDYPFAFVGVVGAIEADSWTISGVEIAVDDDTVIEENIEVGDVVHVTGIILADGTWLAHQIELVEEESGFEFTGIVNSIDPWIVAGIGFEVDEFTVIDEGIEVVSLAHVQGQILADGTWLATSISILDEETEITVTFVGIVDSIDPWIVSGISLETDDDTEIEPGIVVSDTVQVTAVILPDGTFLAKTIELIDDDAFPIGCFTIATTIIGISGNVVTLEGLPTITLDDDIEVEGDLAANTIIIITFCLSGDGVITVIHIVVISILLPPPPSPGGGDDGGNQGGSVTICHIPPGNPNARHTITVGWSAWVNAHQGHGDTLGPCS
jgi:hypothetical protein